LNRPGREPVVPYLGVFLKDITFIEEIPDKIVIENESLINFEKVDLYGSQISQIRYLQNLSHGYNSNYKIEPKATEYFQHLKSFSDRTIEDLTFAIKPSSLETSQSEELSYPGSVEGEQSSENVESSPSPSPVEISHLARDRSISFDLSTEEEDFKDLIEIDSISSLNLT